MVPNSGTSSDLDKNCYPGSVSILGMSTTDEEHILDIRKNVAMVFQNPDNQIVATIVEEDVAFALENLGIEPLEIRRRVDKALELVGMTEYKNHSPYQLSGGQKQRVAIASAVAMFSNCLVLDEPTSMLDPIGRRDVLELITSLRKDYNITIILITHFMEEACLADRLIVMDKGRIIKDGSPRSIFSDVEQMNEIGLDVPQITEFCYRLKQMGMKIDPTILSVTECSEAVLGILEEVKD